MIMSYERWLREPIWDSVVDEWRLDEVLHESSTPFQKLMIARTALGVTLFCDDNPQSAEIGQEAFHEAEIIPALLLAERRERVLVIGCSEGTVPQIAARAGVEHVDHVDIDPDCVRECARHLPFGFGMDEVAKAEQGVGPIRLHYRDGADFVREAIRDGTKYDVVVLDLPEEQEDHDSSHSGLHERDFLVRCRELLAPGGVVSTHISRPHLSLPTPGSVDSVRRPWRRFRDVFGTTAYFRSDEQPWAAIMLGRVEPVADVRRTMLDALQALPYTPRTIDALTLRRVTENPALARQP